jgi:hypothetical protein
MQRARSPHWKRSRYKGTPRDDRLDIAQTIGGIGRCLQQSAVIGQPQPMNTAGLEQGAPCERDAENWCPSLGLGRQSILSHIRDPDPDVCGAAKPYAN